MQRIYLFLVSFALAACIFEMASPPGVVGPPERIPFPTSVEGLPDAEPTQTIELKNGDTARLTVHWVAKTLRGTKVRMLGYNKQIPGPTLKVPEGAEVTVLLTNETELPTSLHSHGIRLEYRFDGVPGPTQDPVTQGETFAYKLRFTDPGMFWYHPHIREDYGQELGLSGNFFVVAKESDYWPPVHREVTLMFDDVLYDTTSKSIRAFYQNDIDYALMGRLGNTYLINGQTNFTMPVKRNEVIRFYATNSSGSRVFHLKLINSKTVKPLGMHIIGSDNGRAESTTVRSEDIIAPSERLTFQVGFMDTAGVDTILIQHFNHGRGATIGRFVYASDSVTTDLRSSLAPAKSKIIAASIDPFRPYFLKEPDKEIVLDLIMDGMSNKIPVKKAAAMHDSMATPFMGIEGSDHMGAMSTGSNLRNTRWILRDRMTGKESHNIKWLFKKGDKVAIRVYNNPTSVHPMPHPIHFHGQRFLVIRENGKNLTNDLAWKDTYLIGTGFTVDLLLDASNPGDWMFHCHIPEHMEAQMMGHFNVAE